MICLGRLQIIYLGMICGCSLSHSSICDLWFLISMIDVWQLPIFCRLTILAIYNGSRQRLLWYVTLLSTAPTKHRRPRHIQKMSAKFPTQHRWPRLLHGIVGNGNIVSCGIHQTSLATTFALIRDNFGRCSYKAPHLILQFYYCVEHQ